MRFARCVVAALAVLGTVVPFAASAQAFPNKPIRIVVAYGAGSLPDQIARLLGKQLQDSLSQPVVIDNKAGALGNIGATEVARSAPDGYTLLLTTNSIQAANVGLFKKLPYDPVKDFTPVVMAARTSPMLLVREDFPARDIKEFLAVAKTRKGGLNGGYGSSGVQVTMAKLKAAGQFSSVDAPYRSVPLAVNDVIAGDLDYTFADLAISLAQIKGGKLKGLGVSSAQRSSLAPDIAAIAETIPGYSTGFWYGLVAPAGTPKDVVTKISNAVLANLNKPEFKTHFGNFGVEVAPMGPEPFGEFIKAEIVKWTADIKLAGIEPQ
ncbi:MAG TPA: tripartite tricarboxylate transporter substrate-binding protein [Pseudorhodoferax sp.]|nr:tripartite tricarboxylate transporter substrate-binding protein [Pseudorhodoferax sp.]